MDSASFTLFDASAGSGKTSTLVIDFLTKLLGSNNPEYFKQFLALTFTNKAVAEMKDRIYNTLKLLSEGSLDTSDFRVIALSERLQISKEDLQKKARRVLHALLNNYASFDVSTLDKFNQRLVRTFSRDLNLTQNYEVILDVDDLIKQAIDKLITEVGKDKLLTKILTQFTLQKVDDDKSFNIEGDLFDVAKLTKNETHFGHLNRIKGLKTQSFLDLKNRIDHELTSLQTQISAIGQQALEIIEQEAIPHNHFYYGDLPAHFKKLQNLKVKDLLFSGRLEKSLQEEKYFSGKATGQTKDAISGIIVKLLTHYETSKNINYPRYYSLVALQKNMVPTLVLKALYEQLEHIKKEENVLPISAFNELINTQIAGQPAPFIYERIGERYKHFFLDEFQDTSILQWTNLQPLISNALASGNSSLFIVGDAKQAIYQWRGGEVSQFLNLVHHRDHSLHVKPEVETLNFNRRSFKTIVDFNNAFFSEASAVFTNEDYTNLFRMAHQKIGREDEGYVSIDFIAGENAEEKNELYCTKTLKLIHECLSQGYLPFEITILVRTNAQGSMIAQHIVDHSTLQVVSSDSLLLDKSATIRFIIHLLTFLDQPEDLLAKVEALDFIAIHYLQHEHSHQFIQDHVHGSLNDLNTTLNLNGFEGDLNMLLHVTLYETIALIIHHFGLAETSDAYINEILELAFEVSQSTDNSITGFLQMYREKADKRSITASPNKDAIQIMTIHKSKGLEFPVVIYPFADTKLVDPKKFPDVWLPIADLDAEIGYGLIKGSAALDKMGTHGASLFKTLSEKAQLDAMNNFYVALTRPVQQLHIVSTKVNTNNPISQVNSYAELLNYFVQTNKEFHVRDTTFELGTRVKQPKHEPFEAGLRLPKHSSIPIQNLSIDIHTKNGQLWNTQQKEAIERGNVIHALLANIKTHDDVSFVIDEALRHGELSTAVKDEINTLVEAIVNHESISKYFTPSYTIYNERELIDEYGQILIPDRLAIRDHHVTIIDYKTGAPKKQHEHQITSYAKAIKRMGFDINELILIYISNEIIIQKINVNF